MAVSKKIRRGVPNSCKIEVIQYTDNSNLGSLKNDDFKLRSVFLIHSDNSFVVLILNLLIESPPKSCLLFI